MLSDRSCPTGKRTYDKKSAQSQMNRENRKRGSTLRIYHCPKCNQWHISREKDYKTGYKK